MQAYLFVHFREKTTPDGEQVYFGLSKDGFHWESVNDGCPVLWAYHGDHGVRDFTITRTKENHFVIFATDLSLAYGMRGKYHRSWKEVGENGSKCLAVWESDDLVNWTEQRLVKLGTDDFGCLWAPDIIYDREADDYLLHWSSSHRSNQYGNKKIWYSRTRDFKSFTEPQVLYEKEDSGIIDSALYEENGQYYLFVKSEKNPSMIILLRSEHVTGPFERVPAFDEAMNALPHGLFEAPTAVRLEDGHWNLFLDFYGARGAGQGYVPLTAESLEKADFVRSDASFSFPYGFKHGTILTITEEEYDRIRQHSFADPGWSDLH